jgi:hypothetical protein
MLSKFAWLFLVGCIAMVVYRVVWPGEVTQARRSCSGESDPVLRQGCIDRALNQPNRPAGPSIAKR